MHLDLDPFSILDTFSVNSIDIVIPYQPYKRVVTEVSQKVKTYHTWHTVFTLQFPEFIRMFFYVKGSKTRDTFEIYKDRNKIV